MDVITKDTASERIKSISDPGEKPGWRKAYVQSLRNNPLHQITPQLLDIVKDPAQDMMLRTFIVEALAWYELSYTKPWIISAFKDMLSNADCPEELKPALTGAIVRLSTVK